MLENRQIRFHIVSAFALFFTIASPSSAQEQFRGDAPRPSSFLIDNLFFRKYFVDVGVRTVGSGPNDFSRFRERGKLYLSEEDAVRLALANNFQLNVERHGPLLAWWAVQREHWPFDPQLGFNFFWDRQKVPATSALAGGDSVTSISTNYSYFYSQAFPTGTELRLDFLGRRFQTSSFFATLVPAINTDFSFAFRQRLFEGFGRSGNLYRLRIARNNLEISRHEFERQLIEVISEVRNRYWDLVLARGEIEVKKRSLELAQRTLEENKIKLEVGVAPPLEVTRSEAELAARREELISAEYSYALAQDQLKRLISSYRDPRELSEEVEATSRPSVEPAPQEDFALLLKRALDQRPEMRQATLEIENRRRELEFSRSKLKPTLDLFASYSQHGLGGLRVLRDFSRGFANAPIIGILPGGLGDALDQLFSGDFFGYALGLELRIPLSNHEARAENAQALLAYRRAEMDRRALEQTIALELRAALTRLEMNLARLEAAEANVRLARETLDGEQARFEAGVSTTRQLIEAQRDLAAAESLELRARIDCIKSRVELEKALGATLAEYNIEISDAINTNLR